MSESAPKNYNQLQIQEQVVNLKFNLYYKLYQELSELAKNLENLGVMVEQPQPYTLSDQELIHDSKNKYQTLDTFLQKMFDRYPFKIIPLAEFKANFNLDSNLIIPQKYNGEACIDERCTVSDLRLRGIAGSGALLEESVRKNDAHQNAMHCYENGELTYLYKAHVMCGAINLYLKNLGIDPAEIGEDAVSLFAIFKALEMAEWTNQAAKTIAEKNNDPDFTHNFEARVVFQDEIHPSITHISNMALVHVGRSNRIDTSLPHLNPDKIKEAAYTFDIDATFDDYIVAEIISLAANIHSHGIQDCKNFYVALTAKDDESMERCKILQDILNSPKIVSQLPQNISVSPFILDIRQPKTYNINLSEVGKLAEINNQKIS